MSYTDTTTFNLGGRTLAEPRARLTSEAGSVLAESVSTGWQTFPGNVYTFTYTFPTGWRGTVEVLDDTTPVGLAASVQPPAEGGGGGGELSGPSDVTLTFLDGNGDPIGPIEFTVLGQGRGRSNAQGVAGFGMFDGSYVVTAAPKNGSVFPNTVLEVSGSTTMTINATFPAIPAPASPALTTAWVYCFDASGSIVAGAKVFAELLSGPGIAGQSFQHGLVAISNSSGLASFAAVKGGTYRVRREASGLTVEVRIPLDAGDAYALPETIGKSV